MTEEPRPAELSRRIDDLSVRVAEGFREVGMRLDRMPTNDILLAYLATRDQEMKTNGEDIKDLAASLANERTERVQADAHEKAEREKADQRIVDSAATAKRWAVGVALTAGGTLLGVLTFVLDFGGPA